MWRRLLNSATLATTNHKKPKRVFDGTGTQVRDKYSSKGPDDQKVQDEDGPKDDI